MVLVQKWPFFFCFFRQYRPRSWVFRYSRTKKCFSKLQKQDVEKVEKWRFVERSVFLILVKNWPFFHVFILGNIGQENVFFDILEEKMSLSYKNKTLKKSKNWDFSKGLFTVLHRFGKKLAIFPSFYFSDYRPGKCVFRYSRRKKRLSKL